MLVYRLLGVKLWKYLKSFLNYINNDMTLIAVCIIESVTFIAGQQVRKSVMNRLAWDSENMQNSTSSLYLHDH